MKQYTARVETRQIGASRAFAFQDFTFSIEASKVSQTELMDALLKALEVARLEARFCVSIQALPSDENPAKPL